MSDHKGYGRLKGKAALVTGSSRGIGLALARGFAREGADVAIVSRHADALTQPADEIGRLGVRALPLAADVSDPRSVAEMVARVVDAFGRIDVLVNNAGIQIMGPSAEMSLASWKAVLDTNLTGVFLCSQAVGRVMLGQRSGSIVNIASLAAHLGTPHRAPYCSAKSGVVGLTRVLAAEWARRGVRVNAISPGYIRTAMVQKAFDEGYADEQQIIARTPVGRVGEPEDLVGPAIFLASDEAAFVTGQVLPVDGGFLAFGYIKPGEGDY
ncbi:MAG: SDR family NAD(P)-dependent oxidoreductase [Chloroflexota bacterium]